MTGRVHDRGKLLGQARAIDGLLSEASDRGQEAVDAVRDVAEDFSETLEDSMQRRPLTTLALAVPLSDRYRSNRHGR